MGRGKVELKRIEDNGSRHVSFSKRRNGLMKKAHELAVLCDVDVGCFVFSGTNRLYEYSTGERVCSMGRGKVELKRIEDNGSRHVSFSKRRKGLMKKAHELAVLCDVDVGCFVFSGTNRLYEYSTGESSMIKILTRYQDYKNTDEIVRRTVREKLASEHRDVFTADELTEMVQRQLEDHKVKQSDATELWQLEKQIQLALQLVRTRKTQLMLGAVDALQEKKNQLSKEKQVLERELLAARLNESNVDS